MINIVERFEDECLDNTIFLEIDDRGHVYVGTRFEYIVRKLSADIPFMLDFFRCYAVLLNTSEIEEGFKAYKKWKSGVVATGRNDYFWNYFEGLKPMPAGRNWSVIKWVSA